uniref:Uncharacterized protein n=1 Tax=Plectus sambesii TaxID=2011161 RepID=A0A914UML0_9BILA
MRRTMRTLPALINWYPMNLMIIQAAAMKQTKSRSGITSLPRKKVMPIRQIWTETTMRQNLFLDTETLQQWRTYEHGIEMSMSNVVYSIHLPKVYLLNKLKHIFLASTMSGCPGKI